MTDTRRRGTAAFSIPYEITAIIVLLTYWEENIPIAAVTMVCLVIFGYDP